MNDNRIQPPANLPHTCTPAETLAQLNASRHGLTQDEAARRLLQFGPNILPRAQPPGVISLFLRQFKNPLIYVLLLATALSIAMQDWSDAGFIFLVLLINAIIGTVQESGAQRSADSLQHLLSPKTRVERDGETCEIEAAELVPGDIVLLEPGAKLPADLRLLDSHNLTVDESLLTGESQAVLKQAEARIAAESPLADRINMAYAGTLVATGRGRGVTVCTGVDTELGQIASSVLSTRVTQAPLIVRMHRFTYRVAIAVGIAALLMVLISLGQGIPLGEILILAVALAISAIPEGMPVALTVALAVGMERMAKRNVIVRKLVAVESLGSCTYIASDKTGTLTINQLTTRQVQLPDQPPWDITGEGLVPEGMVILPQGASLFDHAIAFERLCRAVVLANEGVLVRREDGWYGVGDAADLALLVMAHKAGFSPIAPDAAPQIDTIAYEPKHRFAASLNQVDGNSLISVKGAVETLLPMCTHMLTANGPIPLNADEILAQAAALATDGYRVLAVADGDALPADMTELSPADLQHLTLLGLVAMNDPLRPEARSAVEAAQRSGIRIGMVTGDHPDTALAIARELGLADRREQVVTGSQIAAAQQAGQAVLDRLCLEARIFSRVEPQQKQQIVESLQRSGHFVAVTGDGVNDAPALRIAHVGVAMGKSGTDVARETADMVITDDNFNSIIAGIEEGRIAYSNIRKVIFLLISTGAAELFLFALAMLTSTPLPFVAVQLLWLNLVTNGIQDVALAFEPAEGHELQQPPRPPREPIFNRLMIERVMISALVIGGMSFAAFHWFLQQGYSVDAARNETLLLMVLFENVQAFNSRSETRSLFRHSLTRNRLLLFGTLAAQLIHIGAMYTPYLNSVLGIQPVSLEQWFLLLGLATVMLLVMELHKALHNWIALRRRIKL